MPWSCLVALLALEIGACADDMRRDVVLVEAEAFADCGGWSVDQQFMAQMNLAGTVHLQGLDPLVPKTRS